MDPYRTIRYHNFERHGMEPYEGMLVQAYRDIKRVGRNLDLVTPHQEENGVSDKI
jgi:hypothetical protein